MSLLPAASLQASVLHPQSARPLVCAAARLVPGRLFAAAANKTRAMFKSPCARGNSNNAPLLPSTGPGALCYTTKSSLARFLHRTATAATTMASHGDLSREALVADGPALTASTTGPVSDPRLGKGMVCSSPTKRSRADSSHHHTTVAALDAMHLEAEPATNPSSLNSTRLGFSKDLAKALKSVVKVFTTSACPSYSSPWQMQAQAKSTASGFVIPPLSSRRILTNAHAVANQLQVMLRKHGNARKFTARVLAVGHECDMAMLTVDDDEFWSEDLVALEIEGLPNMQESVTVVGFPQYSHGRCSLLAVQIDAAINSGNSGGPVLRGDKVVGIAFQCLTAGENIGYIIPTPVIRHFLDDLERHGGKYTGFCELGISWQSLESQDKRKWLGLPAGLTGVFVTGTEPVFDAAKVLKAGDVVTHINGHAIADDGTFLFEQAVRIDFRHLISMQFNGDVAQVKVWRDGQHVDLAVGVCTPRNLVPLHSHDIKPRYFIYAGIVFTRLTNFYLRSYYGADWGCKAPIKLCDRSFSGTMEAEGQEVVLLSKVLASEVSAGYQDTSNIQVYKVNGTKVHNLQHLAHLVLNAKGEYVRFDLEWKKVVVINRARAAAAGAEILRQNCIPSAHSDGLLDEPLTLPADLAGTHQPNMAESELIPEEEPSPADNERSTAGGGSSGGSAGGSTTSPNGGGNPDGGSSAAGANGAAADSDAAAASSSSSKGSSKL